MTSLADWSKALPVIKQVSEIGLGIVSGVLIIAFAVYFIVKLSKLLNKLVTATESIVKTNEAMILTLNDISKALAGHDQRAIDMHACVNRLDDNLYELSRAVSTKQDVAEMTRTMTDVNTGVAKLCGKVLSQ